MATTDIILEIKNKYNWQQYFLVSFSETSWFSLMKICVVMMMVKYQLLQNMFRPMMVRGVVSYPGPCQLLRQLECQIVLLKGSNWAELPKCHTGLL